LQIPLKGKIHKNNGIYRTIYRDVAIKGGMRQIMFGAKEHKNKIKLDRNWKCECEGISVMDEPHSSLQNCWVFACGKRLGIYSAGENNMCFLRAIHLSSIRIRISHCQFPHFWPYINLLGCFLVF
jgi:hypothetical protein